MLMYFDLFVAVTSLYLFIQASLLLFIDIAYFTIPWIVWIVVFVVLLIQFVIRIPPPDDHAVKKVLGLDPRYLILKEDGTLNHDAEYEDYRCLRIFAHRGAGHDYFPENTMSAFRYSRERGCDGIEFDLALTKDKVPILFHDDTIDRLTGFNGTIQEMTWDELQELDVSANHPLRVKLDPNGEKIALFEDVLQDTLENEQIIIIDIKATDNEIIDVIINAYRRHPKLYEKAVISSFNPLTIYLIRKRDPKIVAGMAWRPQFYSALQFDGVDGPRKNRSDRFFMQTYYYALDMLQDWAMSRITYYILGLSFILLHKDVISSDVVRLWNKRGIRVLAWTVNLPSEKMHFSRNLKVSYLTDTLLP